MLERYGDAAQTAPSSPPHSSTKAILCSVPVYVFHQMEISLYKIDWMAHSLPYPLWSRQKIASNSLKSCSIFDKQAAPMAIIFKRAKVRQRKKSALNKFFAKWLKIDWMPFSPLILSTTFRSTWKWDTTRSKYVLCKRRIFLFFSAVIQQEKLKDFVFSVFRQRNMQRTPMPVVRNRET